MEIDSKPEELDRLDRRLIQLKIEREALKKEEDEATKKRLAKLEEDIAKLEREYADLEEIWKSEKAEVQGSAQIQQKIEQAKQEMEAARRKGDLESMARIQYQTIPDLERSLQMVDQHGKTENQLLRNKVTDEEIAEVVAKWTGIPVSQDARGRAREAAAHGRGAAQARDRPGRGGGGRLQRRAPFARGPRRSEPPERLVPVPRPDRGGQDRAVQGAGRVPVRYRGRAGPHRHERVHGEALRGPPDRRAAGLRRLRGRRLPDRGRAPQAVLRGAAGRGREGPSGCVQRPAAGARRRPPDRWPGPHGGLPQHRDRDDLEPGLGSRSRSWPATARRNVPR